MVISVLRNPVRTHWSSLETGHLKIRLYLFSPKSWSSVSWKQTSQSHKKILKYLSCDAWWVTFHTKSFRMQVLLECSLLQRSYIPHVYVHADTLGEDFITCDWAAGLSLREVTVDCSESWSFPQSGPVISSRKWLEVCPLVRNSFLPLTMVQHFLYMNLFPMF